MKINIILKSELSPKVVLWIEIIFRFLCKPIFGQDTLSQL